MYQPFESAARPKAVDADGAVASYLNAAEAADADTLPALSVHVPLTVRPVPSGPLYVPLEQLAIPDVASVPDVVQATAWLYQPFESAARPKAVDADGAVASYLNAAEAADADTLPALSVHVPLTVRPVPSGPLYVPLEQLAIPDVASVPDVVQATAWLYQPFESAARPKAVDADGAVLSIFRVTESLELPPVL